MFIITNKKIKIKFSKENKIKLIQNFNQKNKIKKKKVQKYLVYFLFRTNSKLNNIQIKLYHKDNNQ